jgi:hypothetical protein
MMMTGRLWWTLALAACLTLTACDDDNGGVTVSKNNAQPDMTPDMIIAPDMEPDLAVEPDMAPDQAVEVDMAPDMALDGQMAGTWEVSPAAGGDLIVTLVLMHDRDQVPVLGTYTMADAGAETGELPNASYVDNKFSAQWTTAAGQHLLNMGAVAGAEGTASYVSPTSGGIGAAVKLVRK